MAVAALSKNLKDVLNCRQEDIPKLVRSLEKLSQNLKQPSWVKEVKVSDEESRIVIARLLVQSYCHALGWSKLVHVFDKVLKCLPKSYTSWFLLDMKTKVQQLLSGNGFTELRTLSALLDQNMAKDLISPELFGPFSSFLQSVLESSQVSHEEYKHYSVKLCIQVLRTFSQDAASVFTVLNGHKSTSDPCCDELVKWKRIILALFNLLVQDTSQDIVLLTGTALALTFTSTPRPEMTQTACHSVLSVLLHDQTCMKFAAMEFDVQVPDDVSVPAAAMIKGILVSCNKETLSKGHQPLLIQVFPYILQLCHGPNVHHYLAFQLLALWYRKLEHIGLTSASSLVWTISLARPSEETICEPASAAISPVDVTVKDLSSTAFNSQEVFIIEPNSISTHPHIVTLKEPISTVAKHTEETNKESFSCASFPSVKSESSNHPPLMSRDCQILTSTLTCIWPNWDSPVEGVSELVLEVFDHLLNVWHQTVKEGVNDYEDLCEQLMSRTLSLAWHSKSRYRPLRILLKYVNCIQLLKKNEQLKADVMRCMKINHLAAVACDVYEASIHQIVNVCPEALQVWTDLWMPTLLAGLTSTDNLQSLKTRTYWLPPTLKLIKGASQMLLNTTENQLRSANDHSRQQWLFAWISVSALARELLQQTSNYCLGNAYLNECLLCAEDGIRLEALKFLCTSVKRGEPMSDIEASLLQEFIPANLKTDSTAFRQNLTSALKKMLVRIRDSCLTAVRNNHTEETFLACGLQFIEWLYHLLMQSLLPGGCYQRRQTSLDLLTSLLETLVYLPESNARKGQAQESSNTLLQYAQRQDVWKFFSDDNFWSLVYCLEDGVTQIQTQSYHLLVKYFTCDQTNLRRSWISEGKQSSSSFLPLLLSSDRWFSALFHRALYLLSCHRAYENHSGMLMISVLLKRYIIGYGWSRYTPFYEVSIHINSESTMKCCAEWKRAAGETAFAVLDMLMDKMKASLDAVLNNLGANFHIHSLHGLTQTAARCLVDLSDGMKENLVNLDEEEWRRRLEEIVSLNQKMISFVLEVLSGGQHLAESCPSFAEMGIALKNLISSVQDDEEGLWSLSPEFQLLLSWCWLNMKESCSCLGTVTSLAVSSAGTCPLSISTLSDIGQIFVKVLATCRHRGAIEGSRHGLYHYCSSLMSSTTADFTKIPCTILQQMLASVSQNSLASSVTRRSAGLPIFIQTVLQAAQRSGNRTLLLSTVEQLYEVASQSVPIDHNQLQDLSQSHALNILKVIFCDASLAQQLLLVVSKMTILVVESFDSPCWAVRNAATQLISTLVTRIFGQKNADGTSRSMSLEDFCSQFPELVAFVCDKGRSFVTSRVTIKPSLYIVLTLLSGLTMSPSQQHTASCRGFLRDAALSLISSPVFSLRKLSAQAYVALSPLDMADTTLRHILQKIGQRDLKLNELHGWLLSVVCLLSSDAVSLEMCRSLLQFVAENKWLIMEMPACLLPVSTLMQALHITIAKSEADKSLLESLWEMVEACILSISTVHHQIQIGRDQCLHLCIQILIEIQKASQGMLRSRLCEFLQSSLSSSQAQLRYATMDCLVTGEDDVIKEPSIQRAILTSMTKETHLPRILQYADLFMRLALRGELLLRSCDFFSWDLINETSQSCDISSFVMEAVQIGLSGISQNESRCEELQKWCDQLLLYTSPLYNEDFRLYAARSLAVAGRNILTFCSTKKSYPSIGRILNSVIMSSLQFLEDTEVEVRELVCSFVSQTLGLASLSTSWCYPALSRLICEMFHWSMDIVSTLLDIIYTSGQLTTAINSVLSTRQQVLFEPETESAMSEIFIRQIWAYNTLQMILETQPGCQALQQLQSKVNCASKELNCNMTTIRNNLSTSSLFNLSCDGEVMSALLGMIFLSCLYMSSVRDSEDNDQCQLDLIQSLLQIPTLHPFLRCDQMKDLPASICRLVPRQLTLIK